MGRDSRFDGGDGAIAVRAGRPHRLDDVDDGRPLTSVREAIPPGWISPWGIRSEAPPPSLADALHRFPPVLPLTEEEREWLDDARRRTSWSGDQFIRMEQLARREEPSTLAEIAEVHRALAGLGCASPPTLGDLHRSSRLAAVLRMHCGSLVTLVDGVQPVPDYPGVVEVSLLADAQGLWAWWLWLSGDDHLVVGARDAYAGQPYAERRAELCICADTIDGFFARLLEEAARADRTGAF